MGTLQMEQVRDRRGEESPEGTQLVSGGAEIQSRLAELCSQLRTGTEVDRCSRRSHGRGVSPRPSRHQGWLPRGAATCIGCKGQIRIIWNEHGGGFQEVHAKRAAGVLGAFWRQPVVHRGCTVGTGSGMARDDPEGRSGDLQVTLLAPLGTFFPKASNTA